MNEAIKSHFGRLYAPVEEVLRTVSAHMPWGLQVTLADGRVLTLKKFGEISQRDGRWEFGFDLANDDMHLEFMVRHTGGGGAVAPDLASDIAKEIDQ